MSHAAKVPDSTPVAAPEVADGPSFASLGLVPALLKALDRLGYATPTPIQARTIPSLLTGRDVLGQAQTGTGKTAAFALPILQNLDLSDRHVQALILVPTRELAMQVAEAVHEYGKDLGTIGVLPIYGGDPIQRQLARLEGAVRVVVGTPGRVLDHLARGSLRLDRVKVAVLDEADEMLRMGFVDDVEQILSQMPATRQTALFSATLPDAIARIASKYMRDPDRVAMPAMTRTVATVEQRFMIVQPHERLETLARLLTVEDIDAALVFARTRAGCAELSEMLENRGFASEAMHGDMAQSARQSVIRRLKNGQLRIVVATDVAARGLDVDQINLVVNMEMPGEAETYVHRIGRTGRAGRFGRSVQFVMPREERRLRDLERFTGQRLLQLAIPTERDVHAARVARFAEQVRQTLGTADLTPFLHMIKDLQVAEEGVPESGRSLEDIAAALARLAWGEKPLPPGAGHSASPPPAPQSRNAAPPRADVRPEVRQVNQTVVSRPTAPAAPRPEARQDTARAEAVQPVQQREKNLPALELPQTGPVWLSLGVGRRNGVQPRDIVGAIANEAGVEGHAIGAIDIRENFSLVEVPAESVANVLETMRKSMICGRYLNIRVMTPGEGSETPPAPFARSAPAPRAPQPEASERPAPTARPARPAPARKPPSAEGRPAPRPRSSVSGFPVPSSAAVPEAPAKPARKKKPKESM